MIRPAREIEMKVPASGEVFVRDLEPGSLVRVQVYQHSTASPGDSNRRPDQEVLAKYRGRLIKYDRPFDPVEAPEDWETDVEPNP